MAIARNIKDFYTKFQNVPLRRGHEFELTLSTVIDGLDEDIKFYATSSQLPGKKIQPAEIKFQGMTFRLPGEMQYTGSITVQCRCDSNMNTFERIKSWQNEYGNLAMSGGGDKRLPLSKVKIDLLDSTLSDIVRTYELIGCFPSNVGDIELSHDNTEPIKFDLEITYQYFTENQNDELKGVGMLNILKNILK